MDSKISSLKAAFRKCCNERLMRNFYDFVKKNKRSFNEEQQKRIRKIENKINKFSTEDYYYINQNLLFIFYQKNKTLKCEKQGELLTKIKSKTYIKTQTIIIPVKEVLSFIEGTSIEKEGDCYNISSSIEYPNISSLLEYSKNNPTEKSMCFTKFFLSDGKIIISKYFFWFLSNFINIDLRVPCRSFSEYANPKRSYEYSYNDTQVNFKLCSCNYMISLENFHDMKVKTFFYDINLI